MKLGANAKYACVVWYEFFLSLIMAMPRFRSLNAIKTIVLRTLGAKIGRRVVYYPGVRLLPAHKLTVGDEVDFAWNVIVTAGGEVTIGDRVLIGYGTKILSSNHVVPAVPSRIFGAGHEGKKIHISQDVWIGANCVILPGVTVGEGAVIAAGSIVTRDVPPFSVVAGVPARVVRKRS